MTPDWRAAAERAERYEAGLRGEIQQLTERAILAEAKVQDLTAVAQGAGNAVQRVKARLDFNLEEVRLHELEGTRLRDENTRLKAQVTSLLTTLTQDRFPDPAILHDDCRAEIERLKKQIREGNARFDATVERVVAERLDTQPAEPARTGLVATREDDDVVSWDRPARAAAQSAVRHEEVKG